MTASSPLKPSSSDVINDADDDTPSSAVRVLFCGEEFIGGFESTKRAAEEDDDDDEEEQKKVFVSNCPRERVKALIGEHEVAVPLMTRFDEEIITAASGEKKCKLILQFGVGLEGVSIDAATKSGIKVGRIKSDTNPNATSTAEMGVFLTLAALKRANECQMSVESGVLGSPMGESLFGASVLFVGWGRVAKAQARMFKYGFRCKIYALRRKRERTREEKVDEEEKDDELLDGMYEGDISDVDLAGRFPSARNNIVVIACTCTPENRKMIDEKFIDALKFGKEKVPGIVVNVARGALVDEKAMRTACESGKVLYYATDVCYEEPVDSRGDLLRLGENGKRAPNIFVTPHVGGVTVNSYERMGKIVAEFAKKLVDGKEIESDEYVSIVN